MRLTLAQVVSEDEFGLVLRSGSPATLARAVAGAETVEADRPVELSAQDYIILTTGVRLRGHPDFQRRLVTESEARGVAAIGFGVGFAFRSIPRALLDEARKRDFPVFEVPFEVPFRDIIAYINRSHLSDDFYSLKRTVAFQNTLLGALGEANPEAALVARLATIVDGAAILYRAEGGIVAGSGTAPGPAVWDEIVRRHGRHPEPFNVDQWRVVASPILVEGRLRFWVALASRPEAPATGIARPLIQVAERLVRLLELSRDVGAMEERVRRRERLVDLLDEERARDVSPARLELFGFSGLAPWRVVLMSVGTAPDEARLGQHHAEAVEQGLRAIGNAVAAGGFSHLLGEHRDHLAMVVEGDTLPFEEWAEAAVEAGLDARLAVGRPVTAPERLVDSCGDALLALDFMSRTGFGAGRVLRFEDFQLVDALLCSAEPGQLRARSDLAVDALRAYPQLLQSLVAYLDADLNINAAAARLHVHPNSLRYRLGRVEEILGRSLRELATIVDLYVALRAEARFGRPAGPDR